MSHDESVACFNSHIRLLISSSIGRIFLLYAPLFLSHQTPPIIQKCANYKYVVLYDSIKNNRDMVKNVFIICFYILILSQTAYEMLQSAFFIGYTQVMKSCFYIFISVKENVWSIISSFKYSFISAIVLFPIILQLWINELKLFYLLLIISKD